MKVLPGAVGIDLKDWDIRFPYDSADPYDPDLVYHLAASKDAPEGEIDPRDVLLTNAVGTLHILDRWPQAKVVLASTCKACDPETAYGSTKLVAERLVLNAGGWVARFHNVTDTAGNVFEKWASLPADAPIPWTNCHRYFITAQNAVDLLLEVTKHPPGRYLFFPGHRRHMLHVAKFHYPDRDLVQIPRRRGDRISEPLVALNEQATAVADGPGWLYRVVNTHDPVV